MSEVTVVIPAFNASAFIQTAIESALVQSCTREVIVCDDGSTDATRDVVRRVGGSVRLIELPRAGNPAVARNAGIRAARTDYVAFLDADDSWIAGKLEAQLAEIERAPEIAFVSTDAYRKSALAPEVHGTLIEDESPVTDSSLEQLVLRNFVVTSSVLARKDALLEAGMFCESDFVRGVEDYDLWLRLAARYPFRYIPRPWVIYRDSRSSHRYTVGTLVTTKNTLTALARLEGLLREHSPELQRVLRIRRARLYKELALEQWAAGDRLAALLSVAQCVRQEPSHLMGIARWLLRKLKI